MAEVVMEFEKPIMELKKKIEEMVALGELLPDSLVWKQGMATWEKASTLDELKGLFPPPIV